MAAPVHSPFRRFLAKFGFALMLAVVLGSLFGALAYFRHPRLPSDDGEASESWLHALRVRFEAMEWLFYDWHAQAFGRTSKPSDEVVLVTLNEETFTNARQSPFPATAVSPWPRELYGALIRELVDEGAQTVLVDLPWADQSARCAGAVPGWQPDFLPRIGVVEDEDDARLRNHLDAIGDRTVLGFSWATGDERVRAGATQLTPFGVRVGRTEGKEAPWDLVRPILSERRRVFLVPEGAGLQVWVGTASLEAGRELASAWGIPGTPEIRPLTAAELGHPLTAVDLLLAVSEVQVEGLDPDNLLQVDTLVPPVPLLLADKSRFGGVSWIPEVDGKVRAIPQLVSYRTRKDGRTHVLPSAPLAAAMQLARTRSLKYRKGRLEVGTRFSVPMEPGGFTLIQWDVPAPSHGQAGALGKTVSAWNVVLNFYDKAQGNPRHHLNGLDQKVAVFTHTADRAVDFRPTPVGAVANGAIAGQALSNLIGSAGLTRAEPGTDFLATLVMAFVGTFLALILSSMFRSRTGAAIYLLSGVLAGLVYFYVARYAFLHERVWVATFGPVLTMGVGFGLTTLYSIRTEREVRDFIRTLLGRSVSAEVARKVTRDLTLIRPERRPMSMLFSDLADFGELSERLPAEKLVQLLNEYFSEMSAVVRQNFGQVDKYIGDSVMAFWGAPIRTDRHAFYACESALEMREMLERRQADWEKRFGYRLRFRIGINTGEVVVGDMGSDQKSNYTVMGDPVAHASWLENANKGFGTSILLSETTFLATRNEFIFREVDRVRLRAAATPVRVYELMGRPNAMTPGRAKQLEPFARALDIYHRQRFAEALELFKLCQAQFHDPVAAIYVRRCEHLLKIPPPLGWDGVYEGVVEASVLVAPN